MFSTSLSLQHTHTHTQLPGPSLCLTLNHSGQWQTPHFFGHWEDPEEQRNAQSIRSQSGGRNIKVELICLNQSMLLHYSHCVNIVFHIFVDSRPECLLGLTLVSRHTWWWNPHRSETHHTLDTSSADPVWARRRCVPERRMYWLQFQITTKCSLPYNSLSAER